MHGAPRFASGWSAVPLDAEASRRLAQQRIGFFAGVFLVLSVAFYLRNAIAMGLLFGAWPPLSHPAFLLHGAAIILHGAEWSWCRFGRLSRRQLDGLDAVGLAGAMALYGALTVAEAMTLEHAVAVQSAGAEVLLVAIILLQAEPQRRRDTRAAHHRRRSRAAHTGVSPSGAHAIERAAPVNAHLARHELGP